MVEEVRIKQILIANASKLIAITIAEMCMDLQPLEKSAASSNLATQHAIQLTKEVDPNALKISHYYNYDILSFAKGIKKIFVIGKFQNCTHNLFLNGSEYKSVVYSLIYPFIDLLCLFIWDVCIKGMKSNTPTENISSNINNNSHSHAGYPIDLERQITCTLAMQCYIILIAHSNS
eukprot:540717_1